MKKQKNPPINLRNAFSPTPDMCRDAVLHAVSTYREERRMKKTYVAILAAALALLLICGTAFAVAHYYSVRQYVADGNVSQQFDEHVVPLGQTLTSHGITFTLSDMVFDGARFAAAMNIEADASAQPMFVYPVLEGWLNGEKQRIYLNEINYESSTGDLNTFYSGFLYPGIASGHSYSGQMGLSADALRPIIGEVQWKLSVHLYRPEWPLIEADKPLTYEEGESFDRNAFLNQQLVVGSNHSLGVYQMHVFNLDFDPALQFYKQYGDRSFPDMLVESGALTLADTIVFDFTATQPETIELAKGQIFHFDEYDVEVKSITQTFMRVDYEMELRYHNHPGEVESRSAYGMDLAHHFALFDQHGNRLTWKDSSFGLDEDLVTAHMYGSFERISDEPLTSLTFRLDDHFISREYYEANADRLTFTVDLVK